jgi:pseudouridine-5'-phosphate glycosidase
MSLLLILALPGRAAGQPATAVTRGWRGTVVAAHHDDRVPADQRLPRSPVPARLSPEVADALAARRPVVALESTLLAHGLPRPDNRAAADDVEAAVRAGGAVPATIAVLDGVPHVGLTSDEVDRVCGDPGLAKLGVRDLPVASALGLSGATTVSSTALLAAAAGIDVFATGGLGGVHRQSAETFDESADLTALSRTSLVVVCAGVKSILDVPATLERLESLSVTVVGYRTTAFPGFYVADSGSSVDWSVDGPEQAAAVFAARRGLAPGAVIVTQPLPADQQLDPELHDRVIAGALTAAEAAGVRGKSVTPFVLDHLHRASEGATLEVNVRLVLRNAELGGRIAAALAAREG